MSVTRIQGVSGYGNNTATVPGGVKVENELIYKAENIAPFVVCVNTPAVVLPDNPSPTERVTVMANGKDVIVVGGQNPLVNAPILVPDGSVLNFYFSTEGDWKVNGGEGNCKPNAFQTQDTWYIDSVTGSDSKDGKTPATAIKTYAEWQCRVGTWTGLNPASGFMTINIVNDLPPSDPITVKNFFKNGTGVVVNGIKRKVLASGTLTNAVDKDRANNIPNTITAGVAWANFIGFPVLMTSGPATGSYAYICRDLGSNKAHMSSWFDFNFTDADGFVTPGPSPSAGDSFQVLDLAHVVLGEAAFIADVSTTFTTSPGFPSFVMKYLHIQQAVMAWPQTLTDTGTGGISHSILECGVGMSNRANLGNNCYWNEVDMDFGVSNAQGGAHLPFKTGAGYPGGLWVFPGCKLSMGGDPTFVGDQANGSFADLDIQGYLEIGPFSTWNTSHGLNLNFKAGYSESEPFDPGTGETGYVPLWGNGNNDGVALIPGATWWLNQFNFGAPCPLPSWEGGGGPGGPVMFMQWSSDGTPFAGARAHSWVISTASYTVPHLVTWALLDVLQGNAPGDGFLAETDNSGAPVFVTTSANARNPNVSTTVFRLTAQFNP